MSTPYIAEAGVYAVLSIAPPGTSSGYVAIANVIGEITEGNSTKMADVTPHGPDAWSDAFPTINTPEITLELAFIAAGTGLGSHGAASGLVSIWTQQTLCSYSITWPDKTVWYLQAYISKVDIAAPVNGVATGKLTLSPASPLTSLLAWYLLNEGSGSHPVDASGYANTAQWVGTAGGTSGYYSAGYGQSWAGFFDGSTNYVSIPSTAANAFNASDEAAWSLWFNVAAFGSFPETLLRKENGSIGYLFQVTAAGFTAKFFPSSSYSFAAAISTGTWYNLIVNYAPTYGGKISMHLNGVLLGEFYNVPALSDPSDAIIISDTFASDRFDGLLEDVRLYNVYLSKSQIAAIYATAG